MRVYLFLASHLPHLAGGAHPCSHSSALSTGVDQGLLLGLKVGIEMNHVETQLEGQEGDSSSFRGSSLQEQPCLILCAVVLLRLLQTQPVQLKIVLIN